VRVGVLLPTFQDSPQRALATAHEAALLGLSGVFAYDHLWPMGSPTRPALAPFPLLARVGATQPSLMVGPLVARVGLLSTSTLIGEFESLALVAPGGVIAALGTGDRLSEAEDVAYGLPVRSASERRALLVEAIGELRGRFEVWVGAGAADTNELARTASVTLNLWNQSPGAVRAAAAEGTVSWAGDPDEHLERQLDDLAGAGATWAVLAPSVELQRLAAWVARAT
jgi:hypothetical protein